MMLIGMSGKAGHGKDAVADYLQETYGFIKFGFADPLYEEVRVAYGLAEEEKQWMLKRENKETPWEKLALRHCTDKDFVLIMNREFPELEDDAPISPRTVLQVWGTEYRREQDPDYWVMQAKNFLIAFCETRKRKVSNDKEAERVALEFGMERTKRGKKWINPKVPIGTEYYEEHPGLVCTNVRFENEADFLRANDGCVWRIERPGFLQNAERAQHVSENLPTLRSGDKLIINGSTLARLHTGVTLLLQGKVGIVNTGDQDYADSTHEEVAKKFHAGY